MNDAATQPPSSPTQCGAYDIVRRLGAGGMGVVYEARHREIGRRVAIKVLGPEHAHDEATVRRFFNEARAVNLIEHPSLVQISDYGQGSDGAPYLVMEFLSGQTLRGRLDDSLTRGALPTLRHSLSMAQQVADALAVAHEKGVIHRDLKPENLMLVADPVAPGGERVKILDFGIAKVQLLGGKKTTTGTVIGTPLYMSPEQCSGADETTDRSDVYSLGVVLYELLTGRPPFDAEGAGRIVAQHLFHAPPEISERVSGVPSEVAAFARALLHKQPLQRPSMRETAATLEGYLGRFTAAQLDASPRRLRGAAARADGDGAVKLSDGDRSQHPTRLSRSRHARQIVVGGLGLGLLALGAVFLWYRARPLPIVPAPAVATPSRSGADLGVATSHHAVQDSGGAVGASSSNKPPASAAPDAAARPASGQNPTAGPKVLPPRSKPPARAKVPVRPIDREP